MSDAKPPVTRLFVCNCRRSMAIDGRKLASALGATHPIDIHQELCGAEIARFEQGLDGDGPILVACTQERAVFAAAAGQAGVSSDRLRYTDIRERAGWTSAPGDPTPKMAALLAEAQVTPTPVRLTTLTSEGRCLVYGEGQVALDVAALLASRLDVSMLMTEASQVPPPLVPIGALAKGTIRTVTGHLGAFEIEVGGYAPALPSSRAVLAFAAPAATARTTADLIVDVSGRPALFSQSARRDGYIRLDPERPETFTRALLDAADMTGEFEKPLYVTYDADICAHARSGRPGCSKCLDVCPTGAITPAGEHVAIAPKICAGCGACAAVCPTGAASYAYPTRNDLLARIGVLLGSYVAAGGARPQLLIGDGAHGAQLIAALGRLGTGLPAHVLPLEVYSVATLGHDTLAAAFAMGAEHVVVLGDPKFADEHGSIEAEMALVSAILSGLGYVGPRAHLVSTQDPDALGAMLAALPALPALAPDEFMAHGSKRDFARTALSKLHARAPRPVERIPLPPGSPYGRIAVKTEGCTLCLACVGACPVNALQDNPDKPQLSFTEAACVQCGICVSTCPEQVMSREPGYDFTTSALSPRVLKVEEPFHCVSCGKAFGTSSTVERVVAKLQGRHAMYQNAAQVRLIQMCDTCRVTALADLGNDPMRLGERPRVRTTDDYLADRAIDAAAKKKSDDFLD